MDNRDFAIIFDFDGTLADTPYHFVKIANILAKKYGFKPLLEKDFDELRGMNIKEIVLKQCQIPWYKLPFVVFDFKKILCQEVNETKLYPGIENILKELKYRGFRLGLITSSPKQVVDPVLENFKIKNYFEFTKTSSSLFHKEKDISKMIEKHRLDPDKTVYVGDEIRDFEACEKIKIKCLSVAWGFSSFELLQKHNPENILTEPHQILEYFK
jgi:phosphoglycolate phosphatase